MRSFGSITMKRAFHFTPTDGEWLPATIAPLMATPAADSSG